ncbi:MAG TPA: 50S ribosomal protein L11 methyltransferase [Bacteroidetes bacterium]|nr:50S ribosomal protein L11 methyltransferase [Bacteroidota bacterium]HIL57727.1 50S ribosomal protein L11 methyltransferase [Rhodothermales bacterium]
MTRTIALSVRLPDDYHDLLIADLADLDFEAFESEPDELRAWMPATRWSETVRQSVEALAAARGGGPEAVTVEVMEAQDWNATWEASLQPIEAGAFVVAPTWADLAPTNRHVLRIDPKMSFGTGYHESTRLCLRLLSEHPPADGGRALDVGTGTGVLALAALAAGAEEAWGVDVDPWSVPNATENAERNAMSDRFHVAEGSLEAAPDGPYDLVFANILKSTILPMLPQLDARLAPDGDLILAGILQTERDEVVAACAARGLAPASEGTENEWWACRMRREDA